MPELNSWEVLFYTSLHGSLGRAQAEKELSQMAFLQELEQLINKYSMQNGSGTPDFILATYLENCLKAFDAAVNGRSSWYTPESVELPDPPSMSEPKK